MITMALVKQSTTISGSHFTSPEAADAIRNGGFRIGTSHPGMFGHGVYVAVDQQAINHYYDHFGHNGKGNEELRSEDRRQSARRACHGLQGLRVPLE